MPEESNGYQLGGIVLGVLVVCIIGVLVVSVFFDAGDISNTETFDVEDPDLDQVCTLRKTAGDDVTVEYYDGHTWTTISESDYVVAGSTVTVDSDALD